MLTENQEDWDLIKEKLETSFNYGSENLWKLSSEIVAIQVNLSDETSQRITNKSLYQINGEEVGNYAIKHNNNFVIVVVQKAIGQAGTLGIWDIKLNDWCFSISAELFCVDNIHYDEKTDQFFGTYSFNFPMSPMKGTGNFKVTKDRAIVELDYRFFDQNGKETRGIGKNIF